MQYWLVQTCLKHHKASLKTGHYVTETDLSFFMTVAWIELFLPVQKIQVGPLDVPLGD